ncbi:MAG: hypothetical protein QXR51_00615 [Desulfurococcaceae archaeon]
MSIDGILPGSLKEAQIVKYMKNVLEDLLDQVYVVKIPVYEWSWNCLLEINSTEKPCILLPYSTELELIIKPREVLVVENTNFIDKANIEDKVILVKYPKDPIELRFITNVISKKNPKLILLNTNMPGLLKADVVLSSLGYTYAPTCPLKPPVVSLDETLTKELITRGGVVKAASTIRVNYGNIIVGYLNRGSEYSVHVIAHHDTIIGDFRYSPSYYLLKFIERISNKDLPVNLTIISYTAREIGDVEFTEYHYYWGERYLLRIMENKGELERTLYTIAIGPINISGELKAVSHPVFHRYLHDKNVVIEDNAFLLESHTYMEHGIPSITFTTETSLRYRNSNISFNAEETHETIKRAIDLMETLLNNIKPNDMWIKDVHEHVINKLGETELDVRVEATRLIDLMHQLPVPEGVKAFTRSAYRTFYYYCLQPLELYAESALLPSLSKVNLKSLSKIISVCRSYLVVGNENEYLVLDALPREFIDQYMNLFLKYNVKKLRSIINNEIIKTTRNKLVRCCKDVEESNRDR